MGKEYRRSPVIGYTRSKTNKEYGLLHLKFRYRKNLDGSYTELKYSLGKTIRIDCWQGRPYYRLKVKDRPEYADINDYISKAILAIKQIIASNPDISVQEAKDRLDEELGVFTKNNRQPAASITQYIHEKIKISKLADRTLRKYKSTANLINEYEKALSEKHRAAVQLSFDDITLDFADQFIKWCYATKEYSQNTVEKHISILKRFMSRASDEQRHNNTQYEKIKVNRIDTSHHFLTLDELHKLAAHDFDKPTYTRVKDLFLIACYTGLRYSDFSRLSYKNMFSQDGVKLISINTEKGRNSKSDNEVIIPVLPELDNLLSKYIKLPKPYAGQVMNRVIKEVLKEVGINREVKHKYSKAGETKVKYIPIYEKITNHSARYTFIDFMMNDYGIRAEDLRKITGQTLKTLLGYERGNKTKNALKVHRLITQKNKAI